MSARSLTLAAHAKINLSLDIGRRRADGYHDVRMVLQSLSLCDLVTLTAAEGPFTLAAPASLSGPDNLILRAARAFCEAAGLPPQGVCFSLHKAVPVAGGLGGGSADAAAVLRGLNLWFDRPLDEPALAAVAASVGADVPFCLTGGTCLAEGIGERLTPLAPLPDAALLLVPVGEKTSTGDMYACFDARAFRPPDTTPSLLRALQTGSLDAVGKALGNGFDGLVFVGERAAVQRRLRDNGAVGTCLSGSGPTVYGLFASFSAANSAADSLWREGLVPLLCRPARQGVRLIRNGL